MDVDHRLGPRCALVYQGFLSLFPELSERTYDEVHAGIESTEAWQSAWQRRDWAATQGLDSALGELIAEGIVECHFSWERNEYLYSLTSESIEDAYRERGLDAPVSDIPSRGLERALA